MGRIDAEKVFRTLDQNGRDHGSGHGRLHLDPGVGDPEIGHQQQEPGEELLTQKSSKSSTVKQHQNAFRRKVKLRALQRSSRKQKIRASVSYTAIVARQGAETLRNVLRSVPRKFPYQSISKKSTFAEVDKVTILQRKTLLIN